MEPKTLSRVSIIYDQAQTYMLSVEAELANTKSKNDPDELGLATSATVNEDYHHEQASEVDLNIGPTNAYLKFMTRYGMFKEMDKVLLALPTSGPLSPDTITYTTMFSALYDDMSRRTKDSRSSAATTDGTASATSPGGLWTRMCRQYQSSDGTNVERRSIDESVVLIALKCLSRGYQSSQSTAMEIIDTIWSLPRPSSFSITTVPILRGPSGLKLPQFPLTIRAATTIMSVCPKPTDRSHYAQLFMDRSELKRDIDTPFLIAAIRALSETGDIQTVLDILSNYQPRQPNHWPVSVWHDALTAARWSHGQEGGIKAQPDFDNALKIFRRMTHLPPGVEEGQGKRTGDYDQAETPNGKSSDIRGTKWATTVPLEPDSKSVSLLLKIAMGRGWREVEQAVNINRYLQPNLTSNDGQNRKGRIGGRQWDLELAKDVERACERLLEREWPRDQAAGFKDLMYQAKRSQGGERG